MMRAATAISCVLGLAALCFGSEVNAAACAKCRLQAAWGLAAQPSDAFDADTVARYEGEVLSVQEVEKDKDVTEGVYLLLKTPQGNLPVRMAPAWYLKRQGFDVKPYDKVEVLASEVEFDDKKALIATKIKNDKRTVALRNRRGSPVWSKR